MQGSGAELLCAEFLTTASIQVELDRIAVPDLVVGTNVGRLLVQAAQANVQVLLGTFSKYLNAILNGADS